MSIEEMTTNLERFLVANDIIRRTNHAILIKLCNDVLGLFS
jgi:hypothetical protein